MAYLFLIEWKIHFIALNDPPLMLLFLLRTCVICVMGAMPVRFRFIDEINAIIMTKIDFSFYYIQFEAQQIFEL